MADKGGTLRRFLSCDFCRRRQREVRMLIESQNGSHICDLCVQVCVEMLAEDEADAEVSESETLADA